VASSSLSGAEAAGTVAGICRGAAQLRAATAFPPPKPIDGGLCREKRCRESAGRRRSAEAVNITRWVLSTRVCCLQLAF